jgi:hypothetical protein
VSFLPRRGQDCWSEIFILALFYSRYKIVIDAFKQSPSEVRPALLETLINGFLDEKDLRADDLTNPVLQLLVQGTAHAAEFAAYLIPSAKVLQNLDAHVQVSLKAPHDRFIPQVWSSSKSQVVHSYDRSDKLLESTCDHQFAHAKGNHMPVF